MAKSSEPKSKLFCIGYNASGEFGLGHHEPIPYLEQIKYPITKVYNSNRYSFYADDYHKNIWIAGAHRYGAFGIPLSEDSKYDDIETLRPMTYFKDHNIQIKRICLSMLAYCTFFITTDNEVYGCGTNSDDDLGLKEGIVTPEWNKTDHYLPVLIPQLQGAIDIQSTAGFCVALCKSDDKGLSTVIDNYCRVFSVPDDIRSLLVMFCRFTKVYTNAYTGHGHGDNYETKKYLGWKEIEYFSDKNIVKFQVGQNFSVYLGADGRVYSCGDNKYGQLGIANDQDVMGIKSPQEIMYFSKNEIDIVDISSGSDFTLALDSHGNIYAWGRNRPGQCGTGNQQDVYVPRLLDSLKEYEIELIRCGYHHGYCRSKCGKHWIWGQNDDNECLRYELGTDKNVHSPHRIDQIIKRKTASNRIIDVYPGYYATKIICA